MTMIRIATRESALALWQANYVKALLEATHEGVTCELMPMTTEGDRNKVAPLRQMGGKGVFVKELETGLLDGSADIAVHSMKDVPGELPEGLIIGAICEREDPRDALVSNKAGSLDQLAGGSNLGSSSLRRVLQIAAAYPGVSFSELRGNVDTRLRKLDDGNYDAIILAVAGLKRLGLGDRIAQAIPTDVSIPAAGQGAVGIECRTGDETVKGLIAAINHEQTSLCVSAERQVTRMLGATCNLPVAIFAETAGHDFSIRAFIADVTGNHVIRESAEGRTEDANNIAKSLGERLFDAGAGELINSHDEQ